MEKTIAGANYRASRLSPIKAFHVARRLAPVMGALGSLKDGQMDGIANAIASLSDEDSEAVLFGLLRCVSREQSHGMGFAPIVAASQDAIMFADIDMAVMLQLAWLALEENLGGFFAAGRSLSAEQTQKV